MFKSNPNEVSLDNTMNNYFVGKVEVRKIIKEPESKEVEVYLVTFHDGARTKLHYHEVDQVLMATMGKGMVASQTRTEMLDANTAKVSLDEVQNMNEGDFVLIPAFTWHWHGALKGENFAHFQMKKVGKTIWLE